MGRRNGFAWPTNSSFHKGYIDGLLGRAKRKRRDDEYEDGYACGTLDATPGETDRHVRAAVKLESLFDGDALATVSEGFERGYEDALERFMYRPPVHHVCMSDENLATAFLQNYRHGYAAGMSIPDSEEVACLPLP